MPGYCGRALAAMGFARLPSMGDTPSLDPRPSRKLTSREVAVVLGGVLGGVVMTEGINQARGLLVVVRDHVTPREIEKFAREVRSGTQESPFETPPEKRDPSARILGALIASLYSISSPKAIRTAIEWYLAPGRLETVMELFRQSLNPTDRN